MASVADRKTAEDIVKELNRRDSFWLFKRTDWNIEKSKLPVSGIDAKTEFGKIISDAIRANTAGTDRNASANPGDNTGKSTSGIDLKKVAKKIDNEKQAVKAAADAKQTIIKIQEAVAAVISVQGVNWTQIEKAIEKAYDSLGKGKKTRNPAIKYVILERLEPMVDAAILGSGSPDFSKVMEYLQDAVKEVSVVAEAVKKTAEDGKSLAEIQKAAKEASYGQDIVFSCTNMDRRLDAEAMLKNAGLTTPADYIVTTGASSIKITVSGKSAIDKLAKYYNPTAIKIGDLSNFVAVDHMNKCDWKAVKKQWKKVKGLGDFVADDAHQGFQIGKCKYTYRNQNEVHMNFVSGTTEAEKIKYFKALVDNAKKRGLTAINSTSVDAEFNHLLEVASLAAGMTFTAPSEPAPVQTEAAPQPEPVQESEMDKIKRLLQTIEFNGTDIYIGSNGRLSREDANLLNKFFANANDVYGGAGSGAIAEAIKKMGIPAAELKELGTAFIKTKNPGKSNWSYSISYTTGKHAELTSAIIKSRS